MPAPPYPQQILFEDGWDDALPSEFINEIELLVDHEIRMTNPDETGSGTDGTKCLSYCRYIPPHGLLVHWDCDDDVAKIREVVMIVDGEDFETPPDDTNP